MKLKLFWALGLALAPSFASAHTGHGAGFVAGVAHPFMGADHVLAMVAVGLWAALMAGRAIWALPLAFVAAMLAGGALGAGGMALPMVEPMILASIIVLGVAAGLAVNLPVSLAATGVAVFGLFHGFAHGAEGPQSGLAPYALGFAAATLALHGAGLALGAGLSRGAVRVMGAGAAVAGLALAAI